MLLLLNAWACWVHDGFKNLQEQDYIPTNTYQDLKLTKGENSMTVAQHLRQVLLNVRNEVKSMEVVDLDLLLSISHYTVVWQDYYKNVFDIIHITLQENRTCSFR
jgi:hypothetical protein